VQLLTQAWPLALSGLAIGIYMRVDRVMIGEMLTPREVGLYATAATLSELLYFIPVAMAASLAPIVARSRDGGDDARYRRRMQSLYDFMALFGWAVAFGVALAAPYLFALLFSEAYSDAAAVLRIHVFALPFVGLGLARSRWLVAEGHLRLSLVTTTSGLVANLLLNVWWIPRFGLNGAAWATVVSFAVAGWASGFLSPTLRGAAWPMTRALVAPLRLPEVWRGLRELR
jgi:O-antigen/teichoic acid export membrane protein